MKFRVIKIIQSWTTMLLVVASGLIFLFDNPKYFHVITLWFLVGLKYFKTYWNTKYFCVSIFSRNFFCNSKNTASVYQIFLLILTSPNRSYNSFPASASLALFQVTFLILLMRFLSKFVFFTKSTMSFCTC